MSYEQKLQSLDKNSMIFVFLILPSFLSFYELIFSMPHTKNSRFNLAQFMKAHKAAREKAVDENRKLLAEFKKVQRAQEKVR